MKKTVNFVLVISLVAVLVLASALYVTKLNEKQEPLPDRLVNLTIKVLQEETAETRNIVFSTGITSFDFNVSVNLNDDVYYLKKLIYSATKLPVENQKLTFKGQLLEVGKPLYYYNLTEDSRIHLLLI